MVREIMVPRPDMVMIDAGITVEAALDVVFEDDFSRVPVVREDEDGNDDVLGIVYAKDLVRRSRAGDGAASIDSVMRPVRIIPESKSIAKLMREMQRDHFHMAVVADEYGSIVGLVTLEDCLEELVGEIVDEHDAEAPPITPLPNGDPLIDGSVPLSELNDRFNMRIEENGFDTIAGFLFGRFEHVPTEGESVEVEGWRFLVEKVEGRRIIGIRLQPVLPVD